jgi:hypothetical protein
VAVLHEFLIIALITYGSLFFDLYHWWFAAFAAFSLHLVFHIAQWLIFGKYVPVILTSILALPYCIYYFSSVPDIYRPDHRTVASLDRHRNYFDNRKFYSCLFPGFSIRELEKSKIFTTSRLTHRWAVPSIIRTFNIERKPFSWH